MGQVIVAMLSFKPKLAVGKHNQQQCLAKVPRGSCDQRSRYHGDRLMVRARDMQAAATTAS